MMKTNQGNVTTTTIEEAFKIFNHKHSKLSAKTIGTYKVQFDILIKFMDYYLDRDYREILTLPITAINSKLISEYKYYLQYELYFSASVVNTSLQYIRTFINWNSKQDYIGGYDL